MFAYKIPAADFKKLRISQGLTNLFQPILRSQTNILAGYTRDDPLLVVTLLRKVSDKRKKHLNSFLVHVTLSQPHRSLTNAVESCKSVK